MQRLIAAAAVMLAGCGGKQASPPVASVESAPATAKTAPTEVVVVQANPPPEPIKCQWSPDPQNYQTVVRPSDLVLDGGRYVQAATGEPCDDVSLHVYAAETVPAGLRMLDDVAARMGAEHVRLEIGTEATVYGSREEVVADAAAGAAAAAVIPKGFDFETMALARYDVLHSRRISCRDGMLRLRGKQVTAYRAAEEKWQKRAQKLAKRWLFVPEAGAEVRETHVIDPVLPAERTRPPDGPCGESWISQPALTAVPRDTLVRVLSR